MDCVCVCVFVYYLDNNNNNNTSFAESQILLACAGSQHLVQWNLQEILKTRVFFLFRNAYWIFVEQLHDDEWTISLAPRLFSIIAKLNVTTPIHRCTRTREWNTCRQFFFDEQKIN